MQETECLRYTVGMKYRELGKTGLRVSEIGLGAEWLERHSTEEVRAVIARCRDYGINILDCWMSNPKVRADIGAAVRGDRERWIIQGHLGSVWRDGQYVRTRNLPEVREAFADLLARLGTDYIDLGMIHFVDDEEEFRRVMEGGFLGYVKTLKAQGVIRHIGMSTHNPATARLAALSGEIEMLLFSVNPAFDLLPSGKDLDSCFAAESYDESLAGIDPSRAELYKLCENRGVGITVMKGYAGGRLFDAKVSPFGVALTPVQCLHYALTRPAVASVLAGFDTPQHVDEAAAYETASDAEKDYASVLASAPRHAFAGQCTYCGHCAPCPQRIDVAMVNKLCDLALMQPQIPASVRAHYGSLPVPAGACIACGACETRCPFGVRVTERMQTAQALFGR